MTDKEKLEQISLSLEKFQRTGDVASGPERNCNGTSYLYQTSKGNIGQRPK